MTPRSILAAACFVLALGAGSAAAQDTVKIGVVAEFSGPFADYGAQIYNGMKTYLKLNGDTFGGKKIELIVKDTTGAAPDIAKRLAQELVTRDKVDILAGFGLTPNALAVAPVATEAKKPMVIMNAATSIITTKSPVHRARVAHAAAGHAADGAVGREERHQARVHAGVGLRSGHATPKRQFIKAFKRRRRRDRRQRAHAAANPDFAPFLQRIKDGKPKARLRVPAAGQPDHRLHQGLRGARPQAGRHQDHRHRRPHRRRRAGGDGRPAPSGSSPPSTIRPRTTRPRTRRSSRRTPRPTATKLRPNFMACAGYDGMAAIAEALKKTNGTTDPDALMAAFKGMKLTSPRGPIMIDPETRDIVQTVYVRRSRRSTARCTTSSSTSSRT